MANIMLQRLNSGTPWKYDSATNTYYLEILGVRVAELDSNGNLAIKGRLLNLA